MFAIFLVYNTQCLFCPTELDYLNLTLNITAIEFSDFRLRDKELMKKKLLPAALKFQTYVDFFSSTRAASTLKSRYGSTYLMYIVPLLLGIR